MIDPKLVERLQSLRKRFLKLLKERKTIENQEIHEEKNATTLKKMEAIKEKMRQKGKEKQLSTSNDEEKGSPQQPVSSGGQGSNQSAVVDAQLAAQLADLRKETQALFQAIEKYKYKHRNEKAMVCNGERGSV